LEVVIAMLVLGIGLLALTALQIRSIRSTSFSNAMTVATGLARNQIEILRATAWADVEDGTYGDTVGDLDPETGAMRMAFTRRWSIRTDEAGGTKYLRVVVSWNQDDRPHDVAIDTRFARRK
jgi:type IV pilus modification protein PilV